MYVWLDDETMMTMGLQNREWMTGKERPSKGKKKSTLTAEMSPKNQIFLLSALRAVPTSPLPDPPSTLLPSHPRRATRATDLTAKKPRLTAPSPAASTPKI